MQFASKLNRTYWVFMLLGSIPDILIAAMIAKYLGGGFIEFLLALAGLQGLYLAVWVKGSIVAWTMFSLGGRKHLASIVLDYLRSNNYPEPGDYETSADNYFRSVAENKMLPVDVRLKAAAECGRSNYLDGAFHVQEGLRLDLAHEDAIAAYKALFPLKGQT
jgi:hypothetical protein